MKKKKSTNDQFIKSSKVRVFIIKSISETPIIPTTVLYLLIAFRVFDNSLINRINYGERRTLMSKRVVLCLFWFVMIEIKLSQFFAFFIILKYSNFKLSNIP